jgi:CheY-like chemotaxis protein
VDVNQVVQDAVEMTRARWRDEPRSHGLEVRVMTDLPRLPPVDGRPAELRQVLTNLILNAVDAMPGGGAISIVTRSDNDAVEISVTDNGIGMSDEVRRRIFEPFFTTKGAKGTGLGLAMVYGIVSRHEGSVTVESKEGVGTTFAIRLPVGRGGPGPVMVSSSAGVDGGKRVLLIDDDESVLETLADALREARHEVVVASTGADGLERLRADRFDLVITDLGMPGMSGWEVARAVKALCPDTGVVLVTGWGIEPSAEELRESGVDRIMTKPIHVNDVQAVAAGLDTRRGG